MAATTSQLRSWWSRYLCQPGPPTQVFGKLIGGVPPETLDAYQALEQVLTRAGYVPDSAWSFNCRKIGGTNSWSLHAYGIAIDIDAPANPYTEGDPFSGKFSRGYQVRQRESGVGVGWPLVKARPYALANQRATGRSGDRLVHSRGGRHAAIR